MQVAMGFGHSLLLARLVSCSGVYINSAVWFGVVLCSLSLCRMVLCGVVRSGVVLCCVLLCGVFVSCPVFVSCSVFVSCRAGCRVERGVV